MGVKPRSIEAKLKKVQQALRLEDKRVVDEVRTGNINSTDTSIYGKYYNVFPVALTDTMYLRRVTLRAYFLLATSNLNLAIYKVTRGLEQPIVAGSPTTNVELTLVAKSPTSHATTASLTTFDFDFDKEVVLDPAKGGYVVVVRDPERNTHFIVDGELWDYRSFYFDTLEDFPPVTQARLLEFPNSGTAVMSLRSLKGVNLLGR